MHTNTDAQKYWQYGYREAIVNIPQEKDKRIIFSHNFEQPYVFYLFYRKYSPQMYLSSGGSERISSKCYTIDNAYFGECKDKLRPGDFYLTVEGEKISGTLLKQFNYADGKSATAIYKYE